MMTPRRGYADGPFGQIHYLRLGKHQGHHLGAGRPLVLLHQAAIQFPERITRLIVNGPLPITEEELAEHLVTGHQWELNWTARPGGAHLAELFAIRERFAAGSVPLARISDYVVQALVGQGLFWYGHHAAYMYRHDESLPKVTQPGLFLTNTGDMIYPMVLKAQAIRPDFAFIALPGGGVDIVDQQPDAWADAVAAFVV